jgi:phosphatidylglycerophosphate synthase
LRPVCSSGVTGEWESCSERWPVGPTTSTAGCARRTGQVTRLGEILDQFCDFFFESVVLYVAIAKFNFLPLWVMIAYLAREMWVTTIRRFMAGHQLNIASNLLGKMKTNFMLWGMIPTYVVIVDVLPSLAPRLTYLGQGSILVGIAFGYWSAADYTRQMITGYDRIRRVARGRRRARRLAVLGETRL